jgi:hypothetical protein
MSRPGHLWQDNFLWDQGQFGGDSMRNNFLGKLWLVLMRQIVEPLVTNAEFDRLVRHRSPVLLVFFTAAL